MEFAVGIGKINKGKLDNRVVPEIISNVLPKYLNQENSNKFKKLISTFPNYGLSSINNWIHRISGIHTIHAVVVERAFAALPNILTANTKVALFLVNKT